MESELIGFTLERVHDLLKHEYEIVIFDKREAIEGLQRQLEIIESYLKDVDQIERLQKPDNVLKTHIRHLRGILSEIEDFLDIVTTQNQQPVLPCVFEKLKAFFSCASNPLIQKHHLVKKITDLANSLKEILQSTDGFQLPNNNVTYRTRRQTEPGIIDNEIIVGLEEDVGDLVAKFVGRVGESGANSVIVGMGGSGKTTLARRFYDHEEISKAFPRRAWVCVSQQWNTRELLLQICANLGLKLSGDEILSILRDKLREFLCKEGSCLVVLDDVWEKEALDDFLPTLLKGKGRVLITTRKEGIIQFPGIDSFHIHEMGRLTEEESRELFSKIVCSKRIDIDKFTENKEEGDDFAKLARVMLEKCGGLPMAIVTLAGLLSTKDTIQQWERIKDNVISIIMKDKKGLLGYETVEKVLEFSYLDLPYYLKPCFLYLGTFREDEEIDVDTLINLWVDEGFIKPDQCPEWRLKEEATDILEELVQRCMVQVVKRDYAGDLIKIQIHDLMRDLCIEKARELGLFRVFSPSTTSSSQIEPCHRVVLHNPHHSSVFDNLRPRTLICVGGPLLGFEKVEQLKLLRVLSLQGVKLGDSAKHIRNMVLLRYLRLWGCGIRRLDFLEKLRNLQTFICCRPMQLVKLVDDTFCSMEQLRVLWLDHVGLSFSLGVDKLKNLESLTIDAGRWIVKDLPAAICSNLQHLTIRWISYQAELDAILCCVNRRNTLTRLQTLDLSLHHIEPLEFDLQKMNLERNCPLLKALRLYGTIKKQRDRPRWSFPPSLLSLELLSSKVEEEGDMNQLFAQLPHLRKLSLNEYLGANLTLSGPIPNLHTLSLWEMPGLKNLRIPAGSFPQLQELYIGRCRELERIPDGISNIKTLQLLKVSSMPSRFCKRITKREEGESDGGEDFHLVQHISTITFELIDD